MLHVIKSFDDAVIINAEEKGTTQAISEGTYALQPTFRFLLFKHHLEVVFLYSCLCGGQRALIISTLQRIWETFGKNYEHVLHILHTISSIILAIFVTSFTYSHKFADYLQIREFP